MRYPVAKRPPVQRARQGFGPAEVPKTVKLLTPIAPVPSRMEQRPVTVDRWGFMGLAGNEDDRTVVPAVPSGDGLVGLPPIACALGGFLLFGLFSKS